MTPDPTTTTEPAAADEVGADAPLTVYELAERYDFDECCSEAFEVGRAAWADGTDDLAAAAKALGHGTVTLAFAEWAATAPERPGGLDGFATQLEGVSGSDGAVGHLLVALARHDDGDVLAEEQALEAALARDPDAPVGCELASAIAAERGQLDRAIRLLQRAGARDDHEELAFLRSLAAQRPSTRTTGRNDPCPCGSGRRFKACCLRDPALPIGARVSWVLHRAARFAVAGPARFDLLDLAMRVAAEASGAADDDDVDEADVVRAYGDPFICDLLLFEGRVIDRYLEERGPLLADEERGWIETWRDAPRRLWDVTAVPAEGPVLADRADGDEARLAQPHTGCHTGDVVLARVTETAGAPRLGGTLMRIAGEQIDAVGALVAGSSDADADADSGAGPWADWYGTVQREVAAEEER